MKAGEELIMKSCFITSTLWHSVLCKLEKLPYPASKTEIKAIIESAMLDLPNTSVQTNGYRSLTPDDILIYGEYFCIASDGVMPDCLNCRHRTDNDKYLEPCISGAASHGMFPIPEHPVDHWEMMSEIRKYLIKVRQLHFETTREYLREYHGIKLWWIKFRDRKFLYNNERFIRC